MAEMGDANELLNQRKSNDRYGTFVSTKHQLNSGLERRAATWSPEWTAGHQVHHGAHGLLPGIGRSAISPVWDTSNSSAIV